MGIANIRIALAGLIAGGLLVGGSAAWMHREKAEPPAVVAAPAASVPGYVGPLYDAQGKLVGYAQPPDAAAQPLEQQAPVVQNAQPVAPAPYASRNSAAAPAYEPAPAPARRPAPRVRRQRSTAKSVAIVGGTAGVGAAIGALAGGGKGAAIGALSGGGAGFVYDRLTHNR
ncbi:MAG: hypothetical protein IT165_03685 [Bryobacterales bacterium]|nr:hypothetical protein [Bryobacterales bacterium]